jgi:hypothetical protein
MTKNHPGEERDEDECANAEPRREGLDTRPQVRSLGTHLNSGTGDREARAADRLVAFMIVMPWLPKIRGQTLSSW